MVRSCEDKRRIYFWEGKPKFERNTILQMKQSTSELVLTNDVLRRTFAFAKSNTVVLLSLKKSDYRKLFLDHIAKDRSKILKLGQFFPKMELMSLSAFTIQFKRKIFIRNHYLFKQGSPPKELIFITDGTVQLLRDQDKHKKYKKRHKMMMKTGIKIQKAFKIIGKGRFLCHKELTYNHKSF